MDYSVKLTKVIKELRCDAIWLPEDIEDRVVSNNEVNRAGLLLTGFTEYFEKTRMQICGNVDLAYIDSLEGNAKDEAIDILFRFEPPAVVITGTHNINFHYPMFTEKAKKYKVPLLHSSETTSNFVSAAISFLNVELAPRITRHGVLVEVYGEGVLMLGDSGIGKSECAIELVKRGHRFVADDAVELRKVSTKTIVGSAPENIRNFIELRGIGVVNIRRLFGMGAIKASEKIDMVVQLEKWVDGKTYNKIGVEDDQDMVSILGVQIPEVTIPVTPGRNLAVIIETAAMTNKEKKLGFSSAKELFASLGLDSY